MMDICFYEVIISIGAHYTGEKTRCMTSHESQQSLRAASWSLTSNWVLTMGCQSYRNLNMGVDFELDPNEGVAIMAGV